MADKKEKTSQDAEIDFSHPKEELKEIGKNLWKKVSPNSEIPTEEKSWARRAHLTTLLSYPAALLPFAFPFEALASIGFPFLVWLSRGKRSYSGRQSLEAMYLQTLVGLGFLGFTNAFSHDRVLLVFSYGFMVILHLLFLGIAVAKTSLGKTHNYPFSFIPFLFRNSVQNRLTVAKAELGKKEDFQEFKSMLDKIDQVRSLVDKTSQNWKDASLRSEAEDFSSKLQKLKSKLEEKPSFYKQIKQYLNYFPDTTSQILKQYNQLDISSTDDEETSKRKNQILELLQQINKTTADVLGKYDSAKSFALDVEIEAMKKNIQMGGF